MPGCVTPQRLVVEDKWTIAECDEHDARTRHETVPPVVGELRLIRPGWSNYLNTRRK